MYGLMFRLVMIKLPPEKLGYYLFLLCFPYWGHCTGKLIFQKVLKLVPYPHSPDSVLSQDFESVQAGMSEVKVEHRAAPGDQE
jgi:hypothetical protein